MFFEPSLNYIRSQVQSSVELVRALYHMSVPSENPEGGMSSSLKTPKTRFNVRVIALRRMATQQLDAKQRLKIINAVLLEQKRS